MNIRKLQLDDLVQYSGKVCRVTAISLDNDGKVRAVVENDDFCAFVDRVEPIPLTPEIVQRIGFELYDEEEKSYVLQVKGDDTRVLVDFKTVQPFASIRNTCYQSTLICRYLHELQHGMGVCGIFFTEKAISKIMK